MTDESKKDAITEAEREAKIDVMKADVDIKKADLELKKLEAKAKEAELQKLQAEAEKAQIDTDQQRITFEKNKRSRQIELAEDKENHLYRFRDQVTGQSVTNCIKRLTAWSRLDPGCEMEIIFSSPGGSIIDGFELFDFIQHLRNDGHKITTGSLGYAASMAGILLQAGDVRWIGHQAWLMIHRAAFGAFGKTFEVEDEVKFIKRIEKRIVDIFTTRSNLTSSKIRRNWDRKDWWISADQALEANLVDEIRAIMPETGLQPVVTD